VLSAGPDARERPALMVYVFARTGRKGVATGEAGASRAQPVEGVSPARDCPGGAGEAHHCGEMGNNETNLCEFSIVIPLTD
jgi:hypothetical protein